MQEDRPEKGERRESGRWRNAQPATIVVVDDHVVVRRGLRALLEEESLQRQPGLYGAVAAGHISRTYYVWAGAGFQHYGAWNSKEVDHQSDSFLSSLAVGWRPTFLARDYPKPDFRFFWETTSERIGHAWRSASEPVTTGGGGGHTKTGSHNNLRRIRGRRCPTKFGRNGSLFGSNIPLCLPWRNLPVSSVGSTEWHAASRQIPSNGWFQLFLPHIAAVYIPELKALLSADLVYNQAHLYLQEKHLESWLVRLDELEEFTKDRVTTIHPGHGKAAGLELIEQTRAYLHDFADAVRERRCKEC
jgi:hypothetical protein